ESRAHFQAYAQEVAMTESALRLTLIDSESEMEDATVQLSGMSDILRGEREDVAAAAGWTTGRMFAAEKKGGLSNNDESGSQRDQAKIEKFQQAYVLPALRRIVEVAIAALGIQEKVAGFDVTFPPMREETPKEHVERLKNIVALVIDAVDGGAISPAEARDSLRALEDSLLSVGEGDIELPEEDLLPEAPRQGEDGQPDDDDDED
ncbi:MAG: phage portal protein, partial [Myxococcota bacterium]